MLRSKLFCKNGNLLLLFKQGRFLHKTHYEILDLKKDCTTKDIRKAFIKLSKVHHPDKQSDKDTHVEYIKILEAYKVLSRPNSRAEYDLNLFRNPNTSHRTNSPYSREYDFREVYRDPWADPSFYKNRKHEFNESSTEANKVSNRYIVIVCLTFVSIVITIYVVTLRSFFHSYRTHQDLLSAKNNNYLKELKTDAEKNGNDLQIRRMLEKLEK